MVANARLGKLVVGDLAAAQAVEQREQLAHECGDLGVGGRAGDLEQRGVGERLDRGMDRGRLVFLIRERVVEARRHAVGEHAEQASTAVERLGMMVYSIPSRYGLPGFQ